MPLDATHAPDARSWVESANEPGSDFPIQNLPLGIFKRRGKAEPPRGGVAIGDQILDLAALDVRTGPTLNGLAAMGRAAQRKLRGELWRALGVKSRSQKRLQKYLVPQKQAELFLPLAIGDYSDFFTGIHHATNMGKMLRPDNPLLPNYKWVPIGYHGRGSSIVVSGTAIRRPRGQLKPADAPSPAYGPSKRLDDEADQREGGYAIELEMQLRTPKMKEPVRISRASFRESYWTVAQLLAHQSSNGCNVQSGDLLGTGTISGTAPDSYGSLMELTQAGK